MSKLAEIQKEIYNLLHENFDNVFAEIPLKFDYRHNIAIQWSTGETIYNKWYRKDFTLEIQITAVNNKSLELEEITEKIEKLINRKTVAGKYRIVENNPETSFKDENKTTKVLQYLIIAY